MTALSIVSVIIFAALLCFIEIPKMLKEKLTKELWAFSILLVLGVILVILKSLNVKIPNPSDFIAWVYSPVEEIMKSLTK